MKIDVPSRSDAPAALLCGVQGDIGQATARRLARDGMTLILCDAAGSALEELRADVQGLGAYGYAVAADLADEHQIRAAVSRAIECHGHIDVLVNCASMEDARPWGQVDLTDWEAHLRRNLTTVFLCCRAVTPHMTSQRGGKIVNVASSAGRYRSSYVRYGATVGAGVPYASAHGGILALTRELAFEVAAAGIRVNAVVPGLISTAQTQQVWPRLPEQARRDILEETALGRLGEPEEVAAVISFLASDASSYVTGTAVDVNGGWWMS